MKRMTKFPETDPEAERKRIIKQRNLMLGGLLGAMVVLFYFISIARIGG
ncbi:MAG: hypothetical protein RL339_893 [Pseudomonadota bacterium]|jgi:hypothetical protein